jgi:hypothetical protein
MPQLAGPWGRRIPSPLNEVVVRIFFLLCACPFPPTLVCRSIHTSPYTSPAQIRTYPSPPTCLHTQAVSHLKALVFDDTLILTGANLSQDYFTNRQDRYVAIQVQAQTQLRPDGLT